MKNKFRNLNIVETVFNIAKDCKLKPLIFELLKEELDEIAKQFSCTSIEAFFVANVFCLNLEDKWISINDLKSHFDCTMVEFVKYNDELMIIMQSNIFEIQNLRELDTIITTDLTFKCNEAITKSIIQNKQADFNPKSNDENEYTLLKEISELLDIGYSRSIVEFRRKRKRQMEESTNTIFSAAQIIFDKYTSHPLNTFFNKNKFDIESKVMFSYLLWEKLGGSSGERASYLCEALYKKKEVAIAKIQAIMFEEHFLIKGKWIEFEKEMFGGKSLVISTKAIKQLKSLDFNIYTPKKDEKLHIIKQDKIREHTLFYNEEVKNQLNQIQAILNPNKLKEIQKNLYKKGLPKGIVTLFYRPPGTGKTETVLQLAKKSKRNIMKVEISEIKSMWFGESQKLVKGFFDDYKELCKESDTTPILFFNEADAIFKSRSKTGHQVDNEIQNILLEELENFEGILLATTNLEENLDDAFARRILYKIALEKPNTSVKAKIWQAKMKELNQEQAIYLAKHFDFSGGQINNVIRKKEMQEILESNKVSFDEILIYCKEETFSKETVKVGFKK